LLTSLGLTSQWGPEGPVIFLSEKVLFLHPDDLLDELSHQWMKSRDIEELEFFSSHVDLIVNFNNATNSALNIGTCNRDSMMGGLVVFPSSVASSSLLFKLQEFVYKGEVDINNDSNNLNRQIRLKSAHLCEIYHLDNDDIDDIISLVRRSQGWINFKNLADEFGFSCE